MGTESVNLQLITSKEGLKQALLEALSELKILPESKAEVKPPATKEEASKFLKISLPTLGVLLRNNQIPYFKIGNQIRIRWDELENYVSKGHD